MYCLASARLSAPFGAVMAGAVVVATLADGADVALAEGGAVVVADVDGAAPAQPTSTPTDTTAMTFLIVNGVA